MSTLIASLTLAPTPAAPAQFPPPPRSSFGNSGVAARSVEAAAVFGRSAAAFLNFRRLARQGSGPLTGSDPAGAGARPAQRARRRERVATHRTPWMRRVEAHGTFRRSP